MTFDLPSNDNAFSSYTYVSLYVSHNYKLFANRKFYKQANSPTTQNEQSPIADESCDQELAKGINTLIEERRKKNQKHAESVSYIQHLLNQLPDEHAQQWAFQIISDLQSEVSAYKTRM